MINTYDRLCLEIEDALVRYSADPRSIYGAAGLALAAAYVDLFRDAPTAELRLHMLRQTLRFLLAQLEDEPQRELTS
jgi:hypothetical protein